MVEFLQSDGRPVSVASDSVASVEPMMGQKYKTLICMKGGDEAQVFRVVEEYESVKQALKSDDWERSNGRC
jgi:hypothetical protein